MKSIRVYEYKNCSTCQKALKFLEAHKIPYERIPIVEQPPTISELRKMLAHLKDQGGSLKHLFNTSGVQYRELKIADLLKKGMGEEEALEMLSQNGKLVKRPFLLTPKGGTVGFKPEAWAPLFQDTKK